MPQEIRMPALGQATDELTIISWLKAEGDTVQQGEPLLEVETDKATLEVEAAVAGTLLKIVYAAGETVREGETIAYIGDADETVETEKSRATDIGVPVKPDKPIKITPVARRIAEQHQVDLTHVQGSGPGQRVEKRDIHPFIAQQRVPSAPPLPSPDRIIARPTARYLARQHSVDLSEIKGSGPKGLIEKHDVQAYVNRTLKKAAGAIDITPQTAIATEVPVARYRQIIAAHMTQSAQTIPQIRLTMTADMTRAKATLDERRAAGLAALTFTHLLLRSVAYALSRHPQLNTLWLEDGPRYKHLGVSNVGLAVAHSDRLMVVTIPAPDRVSLEQLVETTTAAAERARNRKLNESDFAPAAITISNLGMYHVDDFEALVNPGQAAILAIGRVADETVVNNGAISIVARMKMSLSVDHRVADGLAAAQFLNSIRLHLESVEP